MYKVLQNKKVNENSYEMIIEAPDAVKNFIPGQFCILMAKEDSERVPLTIYDADKEKGLLYVIYQVVGASTYELSKLTDEIFSVSGPLGRPSEVCANASEYKDKKIVYIGGGIGIAPVYPQVKYLKECGIDVDVIYGARSANLFIIRDKIEKVAHKMSYATDDGSFGTKGFVTDILEKNIKDYDLCVAIGPVIMMKNVCDLTKKYNLRTIVSMNPIMVDGTGMCGACRCEIEGKPKFACIDGPEFDGHKVNFEVALKRMTTYRDEERESYQKVKGE